MKNKQKGFSLVEIVIVMAVIALIGLVAWPIYLRQNNSPKTIDEVLSSISSESEKTYSNAKFEPNQDWSAEMSGTAFNKVDGYDYAVSGVGKGISLVYEFNNKPKETTQFLFFKRTIPPSKDLNEVKNWVGSRLVKYGFTTSDNKTYTKGDDTCNVINDPTSLFPNQEPSADSEPTTNVLEVTCFGKEISKEAAEQMKPFVDQYLAANKDVKASDLTVGPLTIKSKNGAGVIGSSKSAGYDIAEMIVSTKDKKQIALFYAKDNKWGYVTQANDEFGFKCGDMSANPDSRKAFYDQVCLGAEGQVRLDTNNRALQ